MAEISQNVYLHRPIINQFRLQSNEREIIATHEHKPQILKNNLSLTEFGSNKCINNNNFLNNNNLIDNRNSSEHLNSLRRKEPLHLYSTSSTPPSSSSSQSTVAPIHASQMNDIKVSLWILHKKISSQIIKKKSFFLCEEKITKKMRTFLLLFFHSHSLTLVLHKLFSLCIRSPYIYHLKLIFSGEFSTGN